MTEQARPDPLTPDELVKLTESSRIIHEDFEDDHTLHWSNDAIRRLLATIAALRATPDPAEPDPMLGTPRDGRHPDHFCGQEPCPHIPRTTPDPDPLLHTQMADANGVWCRHDGERWPCPWATPDPAEPGLREALVDAVEAWDAEFGPNYQPDPAWLTAARAALESRP